MSERIHNNPRDPKAETPQPARKLTCEEWEALLVDFLDGTLPAADAESFQGHRQTCASCAEMFSQAGTGREWLNFLRTEPEVPSVLVAKILAQTSGTANVVNAGGDLLPASVAAIPIAPVVPFWQRTGAAIASHRVAQPRLLMTAAMAFFSITLTLNMAGVRLGAIRLADLKPAAVSTNLDKQYHMATASVVRHFDNLRIVYEMEARWRELGRDADLDNPAPVDKQGQPSPSGTPQDGNHKNGGKSEGPSARQPEALLWGDRIEAVLRNPSGQPFADLPQDSAGAELFPARIQEQNREPNREPNDYRTADHAERGIA
jgi:hypothetical protein